MHASPDIVCQNCDTTSPTKEGLLSGLKIVSNLHEQTSMGQLQAFGSAGLAIICTRQYGPRRLKDAASVVDCVCRHCHSRMSYDVRPCRPALP
ncbi:protein of unknown function [Bradyrhizobium vignae]|uniref:Uncharacterized protein n=1 Tax=Bradyrhizobium vignae TaxID=1549949 RepID=A0A2U3PZE8_9BRAD|nr:protein of unknown function [Bradyrhizobium vignae]